MWAEPGRSVPGASDSCPAGMGLRVGTRRLMLMGLRGPAWLWEGHPQVWREDSYSSCYEPGGQLLPSEDFISSQEGTPGREPLVGMYTGRVSKTQTDSPPSPPRSCRQLDRAPARALNLERPGEELLGNPDPAGHYS